MKKQVINVPGRDGKPIQCTFGTRLRYLGCDLPVSSIELQDFEGWSNDMITDWFLKP